MDFATNGRGGLDTGSLAAGYYYIFAVADDDNTSNFEGIASLSSTDAATVTGERLVGWCFAQDGSIISPDSVGASRDRGGDAPNMVKIQSDATFSITSTTPINDGPARLNFYSSGRPVRITYNTGLGFSGSNICTITLNIDGTDILVTSRDGVGTADNANVRSVATEWFGTLSKGTHTIQGRIQTTGGTGHVNNRVLIVQEF